MTWSNTGSGTILSAEKSTTFDAQGNAYATVQGTAPFTDTIKVLCNNASKQILISKPFTAPSSTSERCRQYGYYYGIPIEDFVSSSGAASQTKTFTASDFLYSEHIKKYEVKFACGNGTCVFRINGEIKYNKTMCATCPDRSSGITVTMPVTISSTSTLGTGLAQSAFRVCAFY